MAEVSWFRQGINVSHCCVLWWHHGRLRWPSCFSKNVSGDRLQLLSGSVCLEEKMKGTQIGMQVTTQDGCVLLSQCVSAKPGFEFWGTHSYWSHPTTVTMTHLLCHNAFVFSRTSCKWVYRILPGNCWAISPVPRTCALLSQRMHIALLLLVHCEGSSWGQSSPSVGGHTSLVFWVTHRSEVVGSHAKYESHCIKLIFRQKIVALFCVLIGMVGGSDVPMSFLRVGAINKG